MKLKLTQITRLLEIPFSHQGQQLLCVSVTPEAQLEGFPADLVPLWATISLMPSCATQ